jgi:hypothetical protein
MHQTRVMNLFRGSVKLHLIESVEVAHLIYIDRVRAKLGIESRASMHMRKGWVE